MAVTRYPRTDRDARTGSSLRGQPLLALHQAHQAALARATKLHERLAREHHRQSRLLFSKADLRRAAEICRQANREWRERAKTRKAPRDARVDSLLVRPMEGPLDAAPTGAISVEPSLFSNATAASTMPKACP